MSAVVCKQCGSENIGVLSTDGATVCLDCGTVVDDAHIVSEVGFAEGSNGLSSVVGQYVSASGPRQLSATGKGVPLGHSRDSRETTVMNAKRKISSIASSLSGINTGVVEAAVKYFQLALDNRFVQGRRSENLAIACLYASCRRAKTAHLLMDFSDAQSINVFVLGATVLKLVRKINIFLPLTDPSIYMIRFANGLKLGNHTHAVANTALRLLAHMKRDWIHTGRRPSGICGACLFLAARMHNFQPTITEIARIVRIGEATLQKRFAEVSNTRTAALTAEEIESLEVGNDHASMIADGAAADPPAFQRLQIAEEKKRRLRALLQSKPDLGVLLGLPAGTDESALVDADMEGVVKQMRRAMTASPVLAKVYEALESADGPTNLGAGAVLGAEDEDEDEEAEEADVEAEEEEGDQKKRVKGRRSAAPKRASRALDELAKLQLSFPGAAGADMGLLESLQAEVADVAAAPPLASQLRKLGGALSPEEHAALLASENNPLVRAATLAGPAAERLDALAEEKERMIARLEAEMEAYTAELAHEGFSDLDDAELDEWVLTAEQRDQKTRLWEALHHEYLVDQENKRILEAAGVTAKRKPRENRRRVRGCTAEQRVSTKINVDALALLEGLTGEETYRGPAAQLKNEVPLKKMEEEEAVAAKPLGAEPVVKKQERPEAEPARAPVVSELAATSIDALLEEESRAAALPARSTSHAAALSLLAPKRPNPRPPPLAKRPRK